jgi:predicted deacylase
MAGVTRELVRERHPSGEELTIPVAVIEGSQPGPTLAVTAGMHAGEYVGVHAAIRLLQTVDPGELRGRLIVVPVTSTRAFMMRSMQLSPVDEKEVHFQVPGNPGGSYSELLVDRLYRIVREADYLIDLHAGEFAQSLTPWVPVPVAANPRLARAALRLARCFNVPYLDLRTDAATIPAYARFLAEAGITNVWTEIGQNGLIEPGCVELQYEGCRNALCALGMLPGEPSLRVRHRYLGQRHHTVVAERSGLWFPAVEAGQLVSAGQPLGELRDHFGEVLARYEAPFDGIVLYYWTSTAINVERQPHGYNWHAGLVRLAGRPTDEPNVALDGPA